MANEITVYGALKDNKPLIVIVDPELRNDFKLMVHRAINLWPDAPNEFKRLADILTDGVPLQDYDKLYTVFSQPAAELTANLTIRPKEL